MTAPQCMVVGCESSAHTMADLTKNQSWQGWSRLPGDVNLCNLHAEDLKDPEAEWMLIRDERALYVGDSLRDLNEYILVGIHDTNLQGFGTGREFSHPDNEGIGLELTVRRRGDQEKGMTLVIPSNELAKSLKSWVKLLPPFDN